MTVPATTKRRRKPSLAAALNNARKAHMPVKTAVVEPDGKIVLTFGEPETAKVSAPGDDLDRELEEFERQHGEG